LTRDQGEAKASQERAAAKAESAEDIEDLDITPRDQIIQLVEKSFPTQQYEQYIDENGNERSRPVLDSQGNPVQNKEAVRMKEALIDRLASIRVPQGPLDIILDHFGVENVAEVTGRKRRFVLKEDEKTGERKRVEESRPGSANQSETDAFQGGKKRILVFSDAGGTGASYHADNASASKNARRSHYLLQAGWRADKAVQGFGRTHRTNQASAPIFHLVTTDLKGQKRFISSIARRLGQLGALTKGERKAADQGIFSQRDNLESREAEIALEQFWRDLDANRTPVTSADFAQQTGLSTRDADGNLKDAPPITQFLNRLLSLKTDLQNAVFQAFDDRLEAVIDSRTQAGLIDAGLETIRADKIKKDGQKTVHTDKESGAETKYVRLTLSNKFYPTKIETVLKNRDRKVQYWTKSPKGRVYAAVEAPHLTNADTGVIVPQTRLIGPSSSCVVKQSDIGRDWQNIELDEARKLWQDEIDKAPEYVDQKQHLITGAILPIWDRLKGSTRIVRLQTDEGERLLGRIIPPSKLAETLKALGAEGEQGKTDPGQLLAALMGGGRAALANGWTLKRSLVAGEHRIELVGPSSYSEGEQVKRDGVFTERINYNLRYFIPTDSERGTKTLAAITEHRPVVEQSGGSSDEDIAGLWNLFGISTLGAPPVWEHLTAFRINR
jgi:C-terminal domain on Strawberry notch homologue